MILPLQPHRDSSATKRMEIERPELRGPGGASSSSSSSSVARYLSNAGLSRTHSSYTGCEDLELEIRCRHLREIADRIELAHFRMLNEHDRQAVAISEWAPYARFIPFYPELPSKSSQINHTAQLAPCTRSPQRGASIYHEVPGERGKVQTNLNLGSHWGPWVPSLLGREVAIPHAELRFFPEPRNGSGPLCQSIEPVEAVCATGSVQYIRIDNRTLHDPILQNQFTGYNVTFPPQVMHERPPSLLMPVLVPVPIIEKKIESSADKNKKRKREYGNEVMQVKPTMQWSKWPCVRCSVNFDCKEAMDAHLQEQHQDCKGDGPSESEKVEKSRIDEAGTGLAVTSDGYQMEISEVSETHANKKVHSDLPPSNMKQKHDKVNKDEVVPVLENKENIGSNTSMKMKLVVPHLNLERESDKPNKDEDVPTPENMEIAGSHTNKKIKLDLPPSNIRKKPDELGGEEFVQIPHNKEIAGSNVNRKMKPDFPSSNSKQKSDEPSKEKVMPTPENKEIADSSNNKKIKLDLPTLNLEKKSVNALQNGSQKSNSPNRMVTEKPLQGASQAASVPKLESPKETRKGEVVATPENKEIAGSSDDKQINLDLPTLNLEKKFVKALRNGSQNSKSANRMVTEKPVQGASQAVSVPKLEGQKGKHKDPSKEEIVQTSENKEIAGFSNNTRGTRANPKKSDEPSKEEVVPSPKNKEIAGFSKNKNAQLNLPTLNLEQKSVKQNRVLLAPGNKETAGSSIESTIPTGHKKPAIGTTTEMTLDEHFQSNDNNGKLKAVLNGSQKSKPSNRIVTEKSVQGASQAASVPKLEDPKEETSKSVTLPKPVQGASQAASVSKLEDPKEQTSKSITIPEAVQGASQAASMPNMVKPKEETSKSMPMPQENKLKEVTSQDKEIRSLKSRTVILSGHRKTAQTTVEFSEKDYVLVNGTTMPMLVKEDGKWFCNLCQAKYMNEKCKEEHINGKRHWLNLQAQPVSCRSEPAEPVIVMTDGTTKPLLVLTDGNWFCNLCQTKQMSENIKEHHIKGKRHKQNLEAQALSHKPEPAKPSAGLHWCYICNIVCTTEDNLTAHYNGKQHREVLIAHYRSI